MNLEEILQELKCTICLNTFTIPFVLQCGHSFCRDCIVEYSNSVRTHQCPLCKQRYQKSKISLNISLENVIQYFQKDQTIQNEVMSKKLSHSNHFYICLSNLPEFMQEKINRFCTQFKIRVNQEFNERVTHLVAGPASQDVTIVRRTPKYIQALVKGIWVVTIEWIIESLKCDQILYEEQFEVLGDENILGGPQISRLHEGCNKLLESFSFLIESSNNCKIKIDNIAQIIKQCGGLVVKNKKSNITIILKLQDDPIVNNKWREVNPISVNQKWLFDSICRGQKQNYFEYLC